MFRIIILILLLSGCNEDAWYNVLAEKTLHRAEYYKDGNVSFEEEKDFIRRFKNHHGFYTKGGYWATLYKGGKRINRDKLRELAREFNPEKDE